MKHLALSALAALLIMASCNGGNQKSDSVSDPSEQNDTTASEQLADSTIYGVGGEFGMSTFTLIADKGDTLYLTRTANDGTDGRIYGDLQEGERYALTTRDNGEAIGVLINLTQLERHTKDYRIGNGNLIVKDDTVQIETLNDKEFKTK